VTEPPLALVTGATSGIGRALALELARRGHRLRLVARDASRLAAVADEVRTAGAPAVDVLAADLGQPGGLDLVAAALADVDVLVNAAGQGADRSFPDAGLAVELAQLDLNVRAVLVLSHEAARVMAERGGGRILNVGSTAAVWSQGTYAAGKAWVHVATAGLTTAGAPRGVGVTLLVPGFTRTEFHRRSATDATGVAGWLWLTPERVARDGVDALLAGKAMCVPGRRYRALVAVARHLTPGGRRRLLSRIAPLAPAER
jgi:uncharacterized protein